MQNNMLIMIRRVVFVAGACALGLIVAGVLGYKSRYLPMMRTFLSEPHDTYDVIAAGSSRMYCTLTPIELYRNYNIKAFCLATQQQPIEVSYTYLKKAIALQRPKVVILEMFMFVKREVGSVIAEGVAHDSCDPLPLDWDKVELLLNANFKGSIEDYVIPFLKYHSRWKELKGYDFDLSVGRNVNKGYILLSGKISAGLSQKSFQDVKLVSLSDDALFWLGKIVRLVKSSGAELVMLLAPYPTDMKDAGRIKHIAEFAKENGLMFLNLLERFDEIGLDSENDFYDRGHLNVFGADKATRFIGKFLKDHCRFEPVLLDDTQKARWEDDIAQYDAIRKRAVSGR